MKARIVLVAMLMAMLLLPGATASANAGGVRGVTGSMNLEPPDWGGYYRVWLNFNIHEVNPVTHDAEGMIHGQVYSEEFGWKRLWFEAKCVSFGQFEGKAAAVFVATIVRREGWDAIPTAGNPGEYLRWQVVDGGRPGGRGDVWMLDYFDYSSFTEYWPAEPEGLCNKFEIDETNYADHGNLVIH